MSSKTSSGEKSSRSMKDKNADKLKQQKLFVENQQIIFRMEKDIQKFRLEETKINSDNCIQALQEIADVRLQSLQQTQELGKLISDALSELNITDLSLVNRMIAFKNIEAQAITPLTQLPTILKSIKRYLIINSNPISNCCLKVFYSYISLICNKPQQLDMKSLLKITIKNFITFIAESIYHIFKPLFLFLQKKKINVYLALIERFVPTFITESNEWKSIYPKVIKHFGKKNLKVLRDEEPSYFEMGSQYNCQSCPNPFIRTIVNLQQLDSAFSIKEKIKILKQVKDSISLDIKDHQQSTMIQFSQPPQQDLLPCLEYCIMKSDRGGIVQAMQYIQLFYEKQNKKDFVQQYLDSKGVNHLIQSIKIAGMALRQRDIQLSIMATNIDNPM